MAIFGQGRSLLPSSAVLSFWGRLFIIRAFLGALLLCFSVTVVAKAEEVPLPNPIVLGNEPATESEALLVGEVAPQSVFASPAILQNPGNQPQPAGAVKTERSAIQKPSENAPKSSHHSLANSAGERSKAPQPANGVSSAVPRSVSAPSVSSSAHSGENVRASRSTTRQGRRRRNSSVAEVNKPSKTVQSGNNASGSPSVSAVAGSELLVRVLLYNGSGKVRLGSKGTLLVDGRDCGRSEVQVSCSGSEQHCYSGSGGITLYNGSPYYGSMVVSVKNGKVQVVNCVDLEKYLGSVVTHELLCSDMEAMKAQAVLARTYALAKLQKRQAQSSWDLGCYTGDQVYDSEENARARQAVEQTRGMVLSYNGKLADQVVYHSTCGGSTESNEAVYGTKAVDYLRPARCADVTCAQGSVGKKSVVSQFEVTTGSSNYEEKGQRRFAHNSREERLRGRRWSRPVTGVLKNTDSVQNSDMFSFSLGTSTASLKERFKRCASDKQECLCSSSPFARWEACWTPEELGRELGRKLGKPASQVIGLSVLKRADSGRVQTLRVAFDNGEVADIDAFSLRSILRYRDASGNWCALPSTLFAVAEVDRKVVRVRGRGWGHGLGMCQWGAMALGKRGWDYKRILQFYYAGTQVVPMQGVSGNF